MTPELTAEQERSEVARAASLALSSELRLQLAVVPTTQLENELTSQSAGELFDLSDPDCPVAIRRCRSCRVEMRFDFPGGLRPGLMRFIANVACEQCADREREAEERGLGSAAIAKRLSQSGLPPALAKEVSWESLLARAESPQDTAHRQQAIDQAREWAQDPDPKRGLLFYGPPGTGKTRLAATIAVERLKHSPIVWVSVGVLMAQLDGAWNDEERKAALKVLTSPGAVVLDDLDKIQPNGRMRGQIFTALDKREQARSPIVVTANGSPKDLQETLGEVVVSRLMGMTTALRYPGPDRRMELS